MARQPKTTIPFREFAGKTVNSIQYEENADWQALTLVFSDGAVFSVDFSARVMVRARTLKNRSGDLKMIHDYGEISAKSGRNT